MIRHFCAALACLAAAGPALADAPFGGAKLGPDSIEAVEPLAARQAPLRPTVCAAIDRRVAAAEIARERLIRAELGEPEDSAAAMALAMFVFWPALLHVDRPEAQARIEAAERRVAGLQRLAMRRGC